MSSHDSHSNCNHDHGHNHAHGLGHHHHHVPSHFGRAFLIGILLNTGFVIFELVYGLISGSISLIGDAGHNLGDVVGLILAALAFYLMKRRANSRYTYGLGATTILASLANGILLTLAVLIIFYEAYHRFSNPQPIQTSIMMWVAGLGILINAGTALLFFRDRKSDLNMRGAYLHMMADALVSLGVVIAGFVIQMTDWLWLDPLISVVIGLIILFSTWSLVKESFNLLIKAVPENVNTDELQKFLLSHPQISSVHDLHVWAMNTQENALTAHILCPKGHPGDIFLKQLSTQIRQKYGVAHSTIQIEIGDSGEDCSLLHSH